MSDCYANAGPDEPMFTLLARDIAAPVALREWIEYRIMFGKNEPGDPQIQETLDVIAAMEAWRLKNRC